MRKRKVFCESSGESCESSHETRAKGRESKKTLADFASNDYLGLSNRKDSLRKAYKLATNPKLSAPRASMLVNGYSKLHRKLERRLANLNGFESCILVGSGFLANIALIESLVRKGDKIFIDSEYHASGILASKLVQGVEFFRHNDCVDLENKILSSFFRHTEHSEVSKTRESSAPSESMTENKINKSDSPLQQNDSYNLDSRDLNSSLRSSRNFAQNDGLNSPSLAEGARGWVKTNNISNQNPPPLSTSAREGESKDSRIIIAIEGIYSMSGDIAPKGFAQIAQKYNAILIVDEAHSSGTLGKNLNGYFDYHRLKIAPNFIKLGTFSKALGSYGAYILSSSHINSYLQTRAKPIIYSTALSAFDSALALTNLNFIHQNRARFAKKIERIKKIIQKNLKIKLDSQIFSIQFQSQNEMLKTFRFLKKHGILVGAIRTPSVKIPQLRIILSTKHNKKDIIKLCKLLKK